MTETPKQHQGLGLSWWAIIGLALLAVPRVILHDLHILEEGTLINAVFVWLPPVIWIAVAVARRISRPFLTLLAVGVIYGILLATGHLVFWNQAFPDGQPQLGGNLADIDPLIQAIIIKTFSSFSSGVTGTLVGAVCGLIATGMTKVIYRSPRSEQTSR